MRSWLSDWLWSLAVTALVASERAQPVPSGNEHVYMTLLEKRADPSYLPGDWTFGAGFLEHAVFDFVFAPFVNAFGIDAVTWVGRLVAWTVIARLLIAIGRRLGAPAWATFVSAALFLGINESMGVGAESLFSQFEAKSIAWPLMLGAIIFAIDRRIALAAVLAGLSFTFHSAIGLWAGGSLVGSLLLMPETRARMVRWLPAVVLTGLAGFIPMVISLLNSTMDAASAEFIVLNRVPHHVDPFSFGERGPLILGLMLLFNFGWSFSKRDLHVPRLLGIFQGILAIIMAAGVVARVLGLYQFLLLQPFKILPVLAPLFFFMTLAGMLLGLRGGGDGGVGASRDRKALLAVGGAALVAIALLWNPVPRWIDHTHDTIEAWNHEPTDMERAMDWIADSTPSDAVIASPPWEDQMFERTERAQLVSFGAVTYDRPQEWLARLDRSIADVDVLYVGDEEEAEQLAAYEAVSADEWADTGRDYGVTHVLTIADYGADPLHSEGDWNVYAVADLERDQ